MSLRAGAVRPLAFPALALLLAGCHGCRDGHPYVPYVIESGGGSARPERSPGDTPPDAAEPREGEGSSFQAEPALVAPPGTVRFTVNDVALLAPEGRVFVSAAVHDFDGDGVPDAFAIVRAADGNATGELAYYRGEAHADVLQSPAVVPAPTPLARESTCAPIGRLVVVGRRAVLAEIGCASRASSAPDRWFAVVTGGAPPRVRLAATISDPQGAAALSVDAQAEDRDHDGLDDLALRVTLEGGGAPFEPGPKVAASFVWLDRSAGLSRDVSATESSFASLAAAAASGASRPRDAATVPALVAQMRALWRAACSEGGSPRVIGVVGTGAIPCGGVKALENAELAEVRAYVTSGDPLRAALALDRVEHPSSPRASPKRSEAQGWIAQIAPPSMARAVRAIAAVPLVGHGNEPTWGSLAFDPNGKLLVRTAAGVVRADPDQGDESAADGVTAWNSAVSSADGSVRWIETYDPCDGLPLHATFSAAGGDDLRDIALPISPIGGRCAGSRGAPARATPIAWGPRGIEAIVEGEPVFISQDLTNASPLAGFLGQPVTLGAPRSPDGSAMVVATGAGMLVRHGSRFHLYRAAELQGTYAEQHDCAVSNDAARVACIQANRAWVGTWDAF